MMKDMKNASWKSKEEKLSHKEMLQDIAGFVVMSVAVYGIFFIAFVI